MKKRLAKLLCMVLAFLMVAGCSSTSTETATTTSAAATTTETAAATEETTAEAVAVSTSSADGVPQGDWYIGLANGYMGNTWRAQYVEAFEEKAEEMVDAGLISKYITASTSADVTEQLNQVNNMIADGVDAICINIISPASVVPIIEICKDADVLLVIATDPAGVDEDLTEILVDNTDFFEIMTKWFIDKLDGEGQIVQITGTPGMPATLVRQNVSNELLEQSNIEVLGTAAGSWSQTESQTAMSTFLSTFDNIDGVLTEDVMAEGIIRAYETAGMDVPIMTGDYVMSFFKKWETMPDLEACATTFQPQASADALQYAVRVLNGWELDVELGANPLDADMINAINIPPSYCITKDGINGDEAWAQGYDLTQFISLEEALELGSDLADTAALGNCLSDEQWDAMFK